MTEPFDANELPPPLAKAFAAAKEQEMWGDAIEAFEDWIDETEQRPPVVLVAMAYMLIRDAFEVMVDSVVEYGERALALIAESKLTTKEVRALQRKIDQAVRREKAEGARVLQTREQPLESMDRRSLRDLAYKLGESKKPADLARAARCWVVAATHETDDRSIKDCLARAALDFASAGEWNEATPRLETILANPSDYDDWMPDYAWYRFLDKALAEDDVATFRKRWAGALAMSRKEYFPFARPCQQSYLEFAVKHRLGDIAKHLVEVVTTQRSPREQKPLAKLIEQARDLP